MSLLRNGIIATGGKALAASLAMVNAVIIGRWLGPAGSGQTSLPVIFNVAFGAMMSLGLYGATIFFINNQRVSISTIVSVTARVAMVWTPAYLAILWSLYILLPNYFGNLPRHVTFWLSMHSAITTALPMFITPLLFAEMKAAHVALLDLTQIILQTSATFLLAITGVLTVNLALITPLTGALGAMIMALWMVRHHFDPALRPDWSLLRKLVAFGSRMAAASIAFNFYMAVPTLMLRACLPQETTSFDALGQFSRALSLCALIGIVGVAANPLLLSRWSGEERSDLRARHVETTTRLCSAMAVSIALIVILTAPLLIRILYGARFAPAIPLLRVLIVATALQLLSNTMTNVFSAMGRPMLATLVLFGAGIVNVVMNWWLIPQMAAMGAALSYLICSIVLLFAVCILVHVVCGVRLSNAFILRRTDIKLIIDAARRQRATVSPPPPPLIS